MTQCNRASTSYRHQITRMTNLEPHLVKFDKVMQKYGRSHFEKKDVWRMWLKWRYSDLQFGSIIPVTFPRLTIQVLGDLLGSLQKGQELFIAFTRSSLVVAGIVVESTFNSYIEMSNNFRMGMLEGTEQVRQDFAKGRKRPRVEKGRPLKKRRSCLMKMKARKNQLEAGQERRLVKMTFDS